MSLSQDGVTNDSVNVSSIETSPSSPSLSNDFSSLRVVSDDSFSVPSSPSRSNSSHSTASSPGRDGQGPSALDALAQLCAAEQDSNQDSSANETKPSGFEIGQNDVLSGRGGLTNHHPGNVFFRQLVRLKQETYLLASKREKAGVAKEIVDVIRHLTPPGRFLKKDPKNPNVWVEIGDRKAREKTSQALREGAPELRVDLQQQAVLQQQHLSEEARGIIERFQRINTARPVVHHSELKNRNTWAEANAYPQGPSTTVIPSHNAPNIDYTNRARVVSGDSVGVEYNQFLHEAPPQEQYHQPSLIVDAPSKSELYAGTKRSREDSTCSMQEQQQAKQRSEKHRGPRLKLIKSRMEYCM